MIRDDIRIIWLCSESAIKGSASSRVTKIARIFGTNTSVCSWIWVSAWNSDTTTPTTRPTTMSGDDTTMMVQIASRATSRVSAPVIATLSVSLVSSFRGARMASGEWISELLVTVFPIRNSPSSDRHLHDVFVGLDDAVAQRHQSRDRDVGFRHRRHHVHDVGLARGHRHRLRVGFFSGVQDASDRVLEQRPEGWTATAFGSLAGAAGVQDAGEAGIGIGSDCG